MEIEKSHPDYATTTNSCITTNNRSLSIEQSIEFFFLPNPGNVPITAWEVLPND